MSSMDQHPEGPRGPEMRYTSPFIRQAAAPPASEAAPEPAAAPARRSAVPAGASLASAVAAVLLLVAAGAAAGAVLAHELWTSSPAPIVTSAPAPVTPGGGTGNFGGTGGFGGTGSFGGTGGLPKVTPNANGGFSVSGGGFSITVGPNGIHFGNGSTGSGNTGNGNTGNGSTGTGSIGGGSSASAGLAAKVAPAIVNINTTYSYAGGAGAGTGIVISADGRVITNNHVIDGATHVTATDVGNGRTYQATVVGYDPSHDIAVLQLQNASGLTAATLGSSAKVKVGDRILGLGNAGGAGGAPSSAGGAVTGVNKSITAGEALGGKSERLSGLLQTNAGVEPGDSGGPLVDSQGRVIGVVTAGAAGFGLSGASESYAVPIDTARQVASQILSGHGSATVHVGASAFLGVRVSPSAFPGLGSFGNGGSGGSSTTTGVAIGDVVSGQAAEKAGLGAGDVITSIDGRSISSPDELTKLMLAHHPGDTVEIHWTDAAGESRSASVQLGSGPPA